MNSHSEMILCEAVLLHRATGDAFSCKRKKHWWQNDIETKGIFVEQNKSKYAVKFRLSKDETCCHDLPKAGKAIILRHTTSSDWKTLFITEIRDYTSKGKPLTVTLSFSNWKDFRMWEEELRSKLKVYSFNVEIEPNQLVQKGPAVVHITADYIYVTTNDVNGKFRALYCKNREKNCVTCFSDGKCDTLEIRCHDGHTETIEFQSKHVKVIKKTLNFFENSFRKQPESREKTSIDYSQQYHCGVRSLSVDTSVVNMNHPLYGKIDSKVLHRPIKPTRARYSKVGFAEKSLSNGAVEHYDIDSAPCMYSCDGLDRIECIVDGDSKKTDTSHSDIYISSKELCSMTATENGEYAKQCNLSCSQINDCSKSSAFSNVVLPQKVETYTDSYVPMKFDNFAPHPGNLQSPGNCHQPKALKNSQSDFSDVVAKGVMPVRDRQAREVIENQEASSPVELSYRPTSEPCNESSLQYGSLSPTSPKTVVYVPPIFSSQGYVSQSCQADSFDNEPVVNSNGKNLDDEFEAKDAKRAQWHDSRQCSLENDCQFQETGETSINCTKKTSTSSEYEKCGKSPRGRRSVEEWFPKNLSIESSSQKGEKSTGAPTIIPRKYATSLRPQNHCYENASSTNSGESENVTSNEAIETLVYVFGNEMDHGGAWTIGVTILQRDDNETLDRLKNLENEFGRSQLSPPRSFDVTSDIKINVNETSQGFGVLGQTSHILKYGDIKKLGPSRWIVVEFHFLHDDENFSIFKCDIGVEPSFGSRELEKSHYTSQNISVVKKILRTESFPGCRNTPSPPRSRLPIRTTSRLELCRDLDLPHSLGGNWRDLAGLIGLDMREIHIVEHGRHDSCTEQVLQILENRFPELCNIEFLESKFRELRRPDLIEHLQ